MNDATLLSVWVRRFLLEHLTGERNLSVNTQKSYRDMLIQLLPFIAETCRKPVDRLTVADLSAKAVRQFLEHVEVKRGCGISTRNHRLGAVQALARFIAEYRPEYIAWAAAIRQVPFKKYAVPTITCLDRAEMTALLEGSLSLALHAIYSSKSLLGIQCFASFSLWRKRAKWIVLKLWRYC
jgi:integrase/recombinase XerD